MRKAVHPAAILGALLIAMASLAHAQSYAVDIAGEEGIAEQAIAERIDEMRTRLVPGAPRLASDPALAKIAHMRSDSMAHGAPFAHEDNEGRFAAADRVHERFGPYGTVGENIMMARDPSRAFDAQAFARRAVVDWMNSPGHRENILSPAYDRSGIGVVINGSYAYATQVFWGPPKQAARRAPFGVRRRR